MDIIKLDQIEANVVIVLTSDYDNYNVTGEVIPLWECEETSQQLQTMAIKLALQFTERLGGGTATFTIFDFRTDEK